MDSSRSDWFTRLLYTGAAVGGATFVAIAARHFLRVSRARAQLQSLLLGVAGSDARVVITGASGGIGRELAQQLLRNPSVHVLVGCRDQKKAKSIFRSEPAKVHSLDLLDPDSVQAFVEEAHSFLAGDTGLRMLVNNAGVRPPPSSSAKGFDCTWQTNFLGPFLLTELLARLRQKHQHSPVRVVHVSSRLEKRSELNAELLESIGKGEVPETSAYSDSKRALMLWTSVRAQSLAFKGGLFCHCTTPGMVDSDLGRHTLSPWLWPLTKPLRLLLLRSSAEGALSVAHHALTPAATSCFGRYADGKTQLEDLVIERMGDKQLALSLVKWATKVTALEQRADGYDR